MKQITLTKDFFLGGKATFTVENTETHKHRTYKIRRPAPNAFYPNPMFFVKVMTGCDNENHYSYIGVLDTTTGGIRLTSKSKFAEGSETLKAARWVMARAMNPAVLVPDQINFRHSGKCGRCGRKLTTPESLDRGIGPECWHIMGDINGKQ